MIDGRTVYSPLFAGVFWNMEDYVLADIDRIEVIRGPGAALWGANAVNGVINIITRHARDTQGTLVSVGAGTEDPLIAEARYGGARDTAARGGRMPSSPLAANSGSQAGRRPTTRGGAGRSVSASMPTVRPGRHGCSRATRSTAATICPTGPPGFTGWLQGRWSVPLGRSRLDLQSYYRREYRRVPQQLTHHIDIVDVDAQHTAMLHRRHHLVWGAGLRVNRDNTHGSAALVRPGEARLSREQRVRAGRHRGCSRPPVRHHRRKYEHNDFSGSSSRTRARYLMPRSQIVWVLPRGRSAGRHGLTMTSASARPAGAGRRRSGDFRAESLVAGEAGYRIQPSPLFAWTHRLCTPHQRPAQSGPPEQAPPLVVGNTLEETRAAWRLASICSRPSGGGPTSATPGWIRTSGGATEPRCGRRGDGVTIRISSSASARHSISPIESSSAMLRAVAALPNPSVPAELDVRAGWWVTTRAELWVAGQDLLHDRHPEFGAALHPHGVRAVHPRRHHHQDAAMMRPLVVATIFASASVVVPHAQEISQRCPDQGRLPVQLPRVRGLAGTDQPHIRDLRGRSESVRQRARRLDEQRTRPWKPGQDGGDSLARAGL